MVETRNVHFFNNIFDICLQTEGCMAEEATIRYIFIGHIASILHFHWTVESISIWKIHKTAKSICRSNQYQGELGFQRPSNKHLRLARRGDSGRNSTVFVTNHPFISKFMFLLHLNCLYSYLLMLS